MCLDLPSRPARIRPQEQELRELKKVLAEALRTARDQLPDACHLDALICCGYPLHPDGKPEGADPKRAAHLLHRCPWNRGFRN